jgi:signal transduction histidine kinase
MPLASLTGRFIGDRRSVLVLSLAALCFTLFAAAVAESPDAIGPTMLLPWVALFAFEAGAALGLAAAGSAFGLYLLVATPTVAITAPFILGRLSAFALIGVGVGLAGQKLRRSEGRSRRLVEGLPLVMYTEQESLTYISPQIESLIGYPVAAWLNDPDLWRRALHPADRDRVIERYSAAVAAHGNFDCDYRLVGPDERCVWVRDSSAYVADGKSSYRQGFIVDVTQLKESEARAERNASLMRGLIDGTIDGITLTDKSGRIAIANRPMLRLAQELDFPKSGLMHERLLGIKDSIVDEERFERRMRELAASPDLESSDEFELRDSERVFQGYTKPVIGADDAYLGRVWTLREVTEARQVDRIKDALVATVSHELRTPLTSIVGYLELLNAPEAGLSEESARYIEVVRRNAGRLQRMVEELLFLARVDAGGLSLEREDVDVVDLARSALGSATPAAEARDITLKFDGPDSASTNADANRLGQVFDNLISNAIKFTPAGGRVTISVNGDDDSIVASVSDTGCGIPEWEQPRLFERFFRSSATQEVPGTGLGLTIVRAIVESHGGSISCDSVEGKGTTFTFALPRAAETRETAQPESRRPAVVEH